MKQVIILLGFSSRWQDWILFKRDHNPIGFSSWHQEMDKYFTTENRHARHNSGSTALAREKFQFWVYMMQHEVSENYSDLCNRGRLCSFAQSQLQLGTDQNRPTQFYWCRLHGPTTPLQFLRERPSEGQSDKKSDLETESLAQLADCAQTASLLNLFML